MRWKSLFCIFLVLFLFGGISAQGLEDIAERVEEGVEKVEEIEEKLTDEEVATEYLKQEWTKILNKTAIGPFVNQADSYLEISSPFFEFFLDVPYSLSWQFVTTLLIFIVLILYISRIMAFFDPFLIKYGQYLKIVLFAFSVYLLIITKVSKTLAFLVINFISGRGPWWAQLISILVFVLILIVLGVYSKSIEYIFKTLKERRRLLVLEQKDKQREEDEKFLQRGRIAQRIRELEKKVKKLEKKLAKSEGFDVKSETELINARKLLVDLGKELEG